MTINFDNTIPAAGNNPSNDQPIMLNNNIAIAQFVAIDHIGFGNGSFTNGYHNVIHFATQAADPATVPNYGQLYTKTVSGDQYLFYETGTAGTVIQLTGPTTSSSTGQTILPGGIIMKWGNSTISAGVSTVTFATAFPTACFGVNISINATTASTTVKAAAVTAASFNAVVNNANCNCFWIALGN